MIVNAKKHPGFSNYLPAEPREVEKLPRAYIANLIYTIIGEPFKQWVQQQILNRTEQIKKEQDLAIQMDPEIFQAFKASTNVSGMYNEVQPLIVFI